MERDSQRKKLYTAERLAFGAVAAAKVRHETVADIERYVRHVCSLKRVLQSWPKARLDTWPIEVRDGRGRSRAGGNQYCILMPKWSRSSWVILHEMAHSIHLRTYRGVAYHGWQYAEIYLRLVLLVLGRDAHDALKAAFKAGHVRYSKPKTRAPLSPERKAQLVATLAAARAARVNEKK